MFVLQSFIKKNSGASISYNYIVKGKNYFVINNPYYNENGIASWYGDDFHLKVGANGDIFDKNKNTAAHKTLPLNSIVRVTNLKNNRKIVVIITDRGPFYNERIIDLSENAAKKLGFLKEGITYVNIEYIGMYNKKTQTLTSHRKYRHNIFNILKSLYSSE